MHTTGFPPMIGISGIVDAATRLAIAQHGTQTTERPLCLTTSIVVDNFPQGDLNFGDGRHVNTTTLSSIFETPIENVINLVCCERVSGKHPAGVTLANVMNIAGPHCDGIRISFDDATTDALIAFRKIYPSVIIVLDITSTAFRERCGGNINTLIGLLSGYTEEYDEPLVNYVYIEIDERKGMKGFPLKQGIQILSLLLMHKIKHCQFGISGTINESVLGLLPSNIEKWKTLSIDAGEALRETKSATLLPDRIFSFLTQAYISFSKPKSLLS